MPLSDDFTKGRLAYLKKGIALNAKKDQEFYSRYQRQYNEMWPYTEGNPKNIMNPQDQVVKSAVPKPDDSVIEERLKEKLFELTRDSTATDFIFNALTPTEAYYYLNNFDDVTKDVVKKIKLPTSKEEYTTSLASVLNSDKNRTSINGIQNYLTPPVPPPALPVPPSAIDIGAAVAAAMAGILPAPGPPLPAPAPPLPAPAPPLPAPAPPLPGPAPPLPAPAAPIPSPLLVAAITRLFSLPDPPITIQDQRNLTQAEQDIGDISIQEILSLNELATFLSGGNANLSKADTLRLARRLLKDARQRAALKAPQPAPAPAPNPPVGPSPNKTIFLSQKRLELNNMIKAEQQNFNQQFPNKRFTAALRTKAEAILKQKIIDDEYDKLYEQIERNAITQKRAVTQDEEDQLNLDIQQKFQGFGIKQTRFIKYKQEFNDKYAIDKKLLQKNILALKYLKNANTIPTFKPIEISDQFKYLIEKYIMKGNKVDDSESKSLSVTEKRVLKRLYTFLKMDNNSESQTDDFQKQFEIMYGSFLAGNNNADLKKQLKDYVRLAAHEGIISKQQAIQMLEKLSKR